MNMTTHVEQSVPEYFFRSVPTTAIQWATKGFSRKSIDTIIVTIHNRIKSRVVSVRFSASPSFVASKALAKTPLDVYEDRGLRVKNSEYGCPVLCVTDAIDLFVESH